MGKSMDLYNKYLLKKEKLIFSKEEIIDKLKKEFNVYEFSKFELLDLLLDTMFDFDSIIGCFCIKDNEILSSLFSDSEKALHQEQIICNRETAYLWDHFENEDYNKLVAAEQEGRLINIVLESKDGRHISEFSVRQYNEKLSRYLNAHIVGALLFNQKCKFKECINDEYFLYYLENLDLFGLI